MTSRLKKFDWVGRLKEGILVSMWEKGSDTVKFVGNTLFLISDRNYDITEKVISEEEAIKLISQDLRLKQKRVQLKKNELAIAEKEVEELEIIISKLEKIRFFK